MCVHFNLQKGSGPCPSTPLIKRLLFIYYHFEAEKNIYSQIIKSFQKMSCLFHDSINIFLKFLRFYLAKLTYAKEQDLKCSPIIVQILK